MFGICFFTKMLNKLFTHPSDDGIEINDTQDGSCGVFRYGYTIGKGRQQCDQPAHPACRSMSYFSAFTYSHFIKIVIVAMNNTRSYVVTILTGTITQFR